MDHACFVTKNIGIKVSIDIIYSVTESWWHMQKCDHHTFAYVTTTLQY